MKSKILFVGAILAAIIMVITLFYLDSIRINLGLLQDETEVEIETIEPEEETEKDEEDQDDQLVFEPIETEATNETTEEVKYTNETESEISVVDENNDFNDDICVNSANQDIKDYDFDDLMLLAKIIMNEAGSDWCSDDHQRAVASVVLNRVADPRFPDSVYAVISQGWNGEYPVQYAVGSPERFFGLEPSERALANAAYVLEHGSTVGSAVWQAEFIQGEIVAVFAYPDIQSSITYICE